MLNNVVAEEVGFFDPDGLAPARKAPPVTSVEEVRSRTRYQ
jgi:hypothetical protein